MAAHAYAALTVGGAVRGYLYRMKLMKEGMWSEAENGEQALLGPGSMSILRSDPSMAQALAVTGDATAAGKVWTA
jgi:hypothetical protein